MTDVKRGGTSRVLPPVREACPIHKVMPSVSSARMSGKRCGFSQTVSTQNHYQFSHSKTQSQAVWKGADAVVGENQS